MIIRLKHFTNMAPPFCFFVIMNATRMVAFVPDLVGENAPEKMILFVNKAKNTLS